MRWAMRKRREELNLTQQDVADMVGISRQLYSHIEVGRREPKLPLMIKIAKALNVDLDVSFFAQDCYETDQGGSDNDKLQEGRPDRYSAGKSA